jgi:8-oxo-dGTP pyrophosphatase MutT (NUDIX family)
VEELSKKGKTFKQVVKIIKREVREETGWECTVDRFITDVSYIYTHDGVRIHKTVRWFSMKPVKKVGGFQEEEVLGIRWATLKQAEKLISYASDKTLLAKIL